MIFSIGTFKILLLYFFPEGGIEDHDERDSVCDTTNNPFQRKDSYCPLFKTLTPSA